jgi:hypothetical protein
MQQQQLMWPQQTMHSMRSTHQQSALSMPSSAQQHALQPLRTVTSGPISANLHSMGLPSAGNTGMLLGAVGFGYHNLATAGWPAGLIPSTATQPATSILSQPQLYPTQQLMLLQTTSAAPSSSNHSTGTAAAAGSSAAACQPAKLKRNSKPSTDGTGKGLTKPGAASRRYREDL